MKTASLDHCEWTFIKEVMKRDVRPELLDSLPGDDPAAIRSRRDLRLINFLMGNERWIMRQRHDGGIIELGAGSGNLTQQLAGLGKVTGLDFQEKPEELDVPWLAGDLFRMYSRFAERSGWRVEVMSMNEGTQGGVKEVICLVAGTNVFSVLKYESGVHRVQRVPATESQGRIHTSAATVAVMPEAEEAEINIRNEDLRIDTYRSQGAGGQHVNTTDSAVRITHLPTGMVVQCQDEKSQHKNKAKAMTVLRSRLYDQEQDRLNAARSSERRAQVGTGERSEKIRTYNFPQTRVTDHRAGVTLHKLDQVLAGEMGELLDAVHAQIAAAKQIDYCTAVDTIPFRGHKVGRQISHWFNSAESYTKIGDASGKAMIKLLESK